MAAATPKSFTFVTYATKRFLPSLDIWLKYNLMHARAVGARITVYLGADVDVETAGTYKGKYGSVAFKELPTAVPAGAFEDYWAAQHYAWKIWIMNSEVAFAGADDVFIYSDCATVMVRLPESMIRSALTQGICFVEDTTQINRHWFSADFNGTLAVNDGELDANQVQAATIVFSGGAKSFIAEAYALSLRRNVIAGPKWAGVGTDGKPFGHRHDQAIFSLLRLRLGVPTVPISALQNTHSMKDAFDSGVAFYVHRGAFTMAKDTFPHISDIMVINLERRKDRLDKFIENHPTLKGKMAVHTAVDGKALTLTPAIARVLRPNDFFWKKAVAGCALSHLGLWYKLASSGPETKSYLILEDDAKLAADWQEKWAAAADQVPGDWDVLYLGGVLPPNWAGFESVKERVAGPWCRVAPNQNFGQQTPTRYFHFCAYAYVLSKAGAQKIMKMIEGRDGFFTSADHIMCNHYELLNMYFLDPKLAACTQEDDPAYCESQFNDFSRIDKFDSDLWNNDERFSMEERAVAAGSLDVRAALIDIQTVQASQAEGDRNLLVRMMGGSEEEHDKIMEIDWLEEMMNCKIHIRPMVKTNAEFEDREVPWVLVSRQDLDKWIRVFNLFASEGREFYAIHLSDEFGRDDISWYKLPNCKGIIRNYWRADATEEKVITLPLGYAQGTVTALQSAAPKRLTWAFRGTGWFDRAAAMESLKDIGPNDWRLYNGWNDPGQMSRSAYAGLVAAAKYVPCVRGNHYETFRMYEALEAGAVPIYVRSAGDEAHWNWLKAKLPLLNIESWNRAAAYLRHFEANEAHASKYRDGVLAAWAKWKVELKERLAAII
jgi:GR25 family glycosyltransferase involved in LPS biosynthesis